MILRKCTSPQADAGGARDGESVGERAGLKDVGAEGPDTCDRALMHSSFVVCGQMASNGASERNWCASALLRARQV
jgi:hypothetical protein